MPEERPRSWLSTAGRPGWALAGILLTEWLLFGGVHYDRYKALRRLGRPRAAAGEGLVVRSDGLGYYAWLRSALIDGDLDFDNEFDGHNVVGDFVPRSDDRTVAGRRANPWSIGPACVWSLTVVPGHMVLAGLPGLGWPWAADGYTLPYQLLLGLTSLAAAAIGLLFLYGICRHYAAPPQAALAAGLLTLGSTVVYYSAIEVSMAHGIGTAAVAALTYYWLKTYACCRPSRWFLVGLLLGAVASIRWQCMTLALLPTGEAFLTWLRKTDRAAIPGRLILAALGTAIGLAPQLVAWRFVYGQWLPAPIAVSHNWLHPALWQVLAAENRGFFTWTPLCLVALAGYLTWFRRIAEPQEGDRARAGEPLFLLFAAFALQVYVLSSLWGTGVYLGVAYGFRHLTETVVLLAPGLALLMEGARRRGFSVVAALGCLLAVWNLLLVAEYRYGLLPAADGADWSTRLTACWHLICYRPFGLVGQVLLGPLLLAVLTWCPRLAFSGESLMMVRDSESDPDELLHSRVPRYEG